MELIDANTTAYRKYVGEIERDIKIIKERSIFFMKTLVIKGILNVHKQIVIHMICFVNMVLNAVRATLGVSKVYYPRKIVTQRNSI